MDMSKKEHLKELEQPINRLGKLITNIGKILGIPIVLSVFLSQYIVGTTITPLIAYTLIFLFSSTIVLSIFLLFQKRKSSQLNKINVGLENNLKEKEFKIKTLEKDLSKSNLEKNNAIKNYDRLSLFKNNQNKNIL